MKKILVLASLLIIQSFSSAFAFDAIIPDGGYKGKLIDGKDRGNVHLLIQANPGCEGCFTAIALDTPDFNSPTVRMTAYTGMPWDETYTKFSLTPINVDTDGELSHPNDDPSLMLNIVSGSGTNEIKFSIVPSGSGNLLGYTGSMDFTRGKQSPFELSTPKTGSYSYIHQRKTNATISYPQQNSQDLATEVNMQWFGSLRMNGGDFNLKEKFPSVYAFNTIVSAATGKTIAQKPTYIVIFAKKNNKEYILMVNPIDSRDVLCLTLK